MFFHFWYLKFVPVDSALNSASGNLTYLFKKCRRGTKKKQPNLKIRFKMFLKCLSWSIITKLENAKTKFFLQDIDQESFGWIVSNFWFYPFDLWFCPVSWKKIAHIVIAFSPEREEEIKPWFWHIWIAQWLTFFRGKRGIKVGPKVLTLDASLFHKNSNPSKKNSNNVLVC